MSDAREQGREQGQEQDERNRIGANREETSRTPGGLAATAFGLSDIGCQRSVNQDTLGNRIDQFTARTSDLGLLYAIADGMGGHARGEIASALAIDELFARYYGADAGTEPRQVLAQVMIEANAAIYQAGRAAGGGTMGTTLTTVLLRDNILYVGNIGDSRTYLIRDGKIKQLSQDHSLIGEQVRSGVLTEAQARTSSIRNVITRAVGYRETVEPDTFAFTIQVGDILLLCSDGLHGLVENEELARALSTQSLAEATTGLVALARERGGPDNITALVVRIDQIGEAPLVADGERTTSTALLDPQDETTRPLPMIPPGNTDEIMSDPAANTATTSDAVTLPNPLVVNAATSAPPAVVAPPAAAPVPPPAAAPGEPPVTLAPTAARQARAPIWLFVLIPLLLIAIVAAGAFAVVSARNGSNQEPTAPAVPALVVTPTPQTTATPVAATTPLTVGTPAVAPTLPATLSTPSPVSGAAAQSTAAIGPGGAPVAPQATAAATLNTGGAAALGQRMRISGTILFNNNVPVPENFSKDWVVVLIDQAEWQKRQQAAEPRAQTKVTTPPNSLPGQAKEVGLFTMEIDLPVGNQVEDLFVVQVRQGDGARIAVTESSGVSVKRADRTSGTGLTILVTSIADQLEPKPSQGPGPNGRDDLTPSASDNRIQFATQQG